MMTQVPKNAPLPLRVRDGSAGIYSDWFAIVLLGVQDVVASMIILSVVRQRRLNNYHQCYFMTPYKTPSLVSFRLFYT